MVSMVLMIDSTKQKDKSMTLSTNSWKPLNQWSKWKRMKKNRDILMAYMVQESKNVYIRGIPEGV